MELFYSSNAVVAEIGVRRRNIRPEVRVQSRRKTRAGIPDFGVLVQVEACVLGPSDAELVNGMYEQFFKDPLFVGSSVSGIVISSRSSRFKNGDRVVGFIPPGNQFSGGCSEYCVALQWNLVHVPEDLSFLRAAAAVSVLRSYFALKYILNAKENSSILVLGGASHIGQGCVQIALEFGLKVIATCSSDRELSFLQSLRPSSALQIVEVRKTSVLSTVAEQTGGMGVDFVVDARCLEETDSKVIASSSSSNNDFPGVIEDYTDPTSVDVDVDAEAPTTQVLLASLAISGRICCVNPLNGRLRQLSPSETSYLSLKSASVSFVNEVMWVSGSRHQDDVQNAMEYLLHSASSGNLSVLYDIRTLETCIESLLSLSNLSVGTVAVVPKST